MTRTVMSEAKESEFVKAVEDRIEYVRSRHPNASPHAQMVGFFEGVLPALLSDKQADMLIQRLNARTKKVAS